MFFNNRNSGSFPVCMDELPNFTPAFEGNFTLPGLLWFQLWRRYLQKEKEKKWGGQAGSINILLAPGNYAQVLVRPYWWNVLMFMHTKGITHSNSQTTISLPDCVIINGLDGVQNAKTLLILNHVLFQILLPHECVFSSYRWFFHLLNKQQNVQRENILKWWHSKLLSISNPLSFTVLKS